MASPRLNRRSWDLLATPSRRAIAAGAVVQVAALIVYYATTVQVGPDIVLLGLIGGTAAAILAPTDGGLWVEGFFAPVVGGGLFLVGFLAWGVLVALGAARDTGLLIDAYLWTTVMKVLIFLPLFGGLGVFAGLLVGLLRRRVPALRGA